MCSSAMMSKIWSTSLGMPAATTVSGPSTARSTLSSRARSPSRSATESQTLRTSTGSRTPKSSSMRSASSMRDSVRMSFTSAVRCCASSWMRPANPGTSAGAAMPASISSAYPLMTVRGVLSSWVTLAVNSTRMRSLSVRRTICSSI